MDEGGDGGFLQGLLLILFSEIGDKTFFIAVLLALQQDKKAASPGRTGATAMTLISVTLGQFLHQLDENLPFDTSFPWDDLLAAALLIFFGVQTIRRRTRAKPRRRRRTPRKPWRVSGAILTMRWR